MDLVSRRLFSGESYGAGTSFYDEVDDLKVPKGHRIYEDVPSLFHPTKD